MVSAYLKCSKGVGIEEYEKQAGFGAMFPVLRRVPRLKLFRFLACSVFGTGELDGAVVVCVTLVCTALDVCIFCRTQLSEFSMYATPDLLFWHS